MTTDRPTRRTRWSRTVGALAVALAIAVSLAACGGSDADDGPQTSTTEHNDADVAFASDMLQHHAQALAMVDLTQGRPLDPEVQAVAEQIRMAQAPEIETFSAWLTDWDEEVPATVRDHAGADHDMDGSGGDAMDGSLTGMDSDMPGMMTADEMGALADATDAQFQTLWLEMMIRHHTVFNDTATTETQDGRYEPAIDLAASIVASQGTEVDTMEGLLD